jgi:hypothetical protein
VSYCRISQRLYLLIGWFHLCVKNIFLSLKTYERLKWNTEISCVVGCIFYSLTQLIDATKWRSEKVVDQTKYVLL